MTEDERSFLFDGTGPATLAAMRIDGNDGKFESCWQTDDLDEFIDRLKVFGQSLGQSAKRFQPYDDDRIRTMIRTDVKVVTERLAWWWFTDRAKPKGSC